MQGYVSQFFQFSTLKLLAPYMEQVTEHFGNDHRGIDVSVAYHKDNRYVSLGFYPAYNNNRYTMDGRWAYMVIDSGWSRFSQKRFDVLIERWRVALPALATLYTLNHMMECRREDEWKEATQLIYAAHKTQTFDVCVEQINRFIDKLFPKPKDMELKINPALTVCKAEGDATEAIIAKRVQNAIKNGGQCIYNCNDGAQYGLPDIRPIADCFDIPEGECFTGWQGFEKVTMIDVAKTHGNGICDLVNGCISTETMEMFDDQIEDYWPQEDCTTVIIRVDLPDGIWFEYVITDTDER